MSELTAIWTPAWYELDQSVKCGIKDEFWLIKNNGTDLKFYNELGNREKVEIIIGEVTNISHKTLGKILEIDTHGLCYTITLASGETIIVEAEETPGQIESSSSFKEQFDDDGFKFTLTIKIA